MSPREGLRSVRESQRDSIRQPRVSEPARLAWKIVPSNSSSLKGMHQNHRRTDTLQFPRDFLAACSEFDTCLE